ncbi:sugar transferase [Frigidibacter sp. MR17.24]
MTAARRPLELVGPEGWEMPVAVRKGLWQGLWQAGGKRLFDLVAILAMAPVILPLIGLMVLMVRRDGGPAFFRQKRVGRHGQAFWMLKMRTMVPDAEGRLQAHLAADPEARAEWDRHQKLARDPRITRVGRLLRRTSLDELPQLLNVLRGEMSLVGPRPMMISQIGLYPGRAYYRLRPGITGNWQVSERHASSFADRARYDEAYEAEVSARTDLGLLWRTVAVVLRASGC